LYNSVPYLERLTADIFSQSRAFDEVLMYDDCSSDDSAAQAESMGFRVIRGNDSRRQSAARNCLLQHATGDFLHFHDHDDPIHPHFVEGMLPLAASRTIVITSFDQIGDNCKVHHHAFERSNQETPYDLVFSRYVHLNAMLICRELALDAGGFDEDLTLFEEKDFLYKLLRAGGRVAIQSEKLAEWRIGANSTMNKQGWFAAAAMLSRFVSNCISNPHSSDTTVKMLEYCLRRAWDFYGAEPRTLADLRLMFGELHRAGFRPRTGLGWKMSLSCSFLGPANALRLRRATAWGRARLPSLLSGTR
jgi:glycosyltransferase involved in cell wall biosynthesis